MLVRRWNGDNAPPCEGSGRGDHLRVTKREKFPSIEAGDDVHDDESFGLDRTNLIESESSILE